MTGDSVCVCWVPNFPVVEFIKTLALFVHSIDKLYKFGTEEEFGSGLNRDSKPQSLCWIWGERRPRTEYCIESGVGIDPDRVLAALSYRNFTFRGNKQSQLCFINKTDATRYILNGRV